MAMSAITLREKFRGCIAATWVGSAMGAAVEGWPPEKIRAEHGLLEKLLPYKHYTHITDWLRPPGTTEDGIERQRLVATAIIEKPGRILAHDLVRVWLRDLDPEKVKYKQEAFDLSLLEMARAGVPASELGKLWPFPNVVSVSRATHPLGLVNAGDPKGAADDTFEVGKVYSRETTACLRWAAMYNACIAEACRPGATVDSVLATAREFAKYRAEGGGLYSRYDTVEREVARAIEIASKHSGRDAMREEFHRHYSGGGYFNYGMSQANEVVSKGLAVFALSGGDPREAIVTAVNFGRDTDCLAAVAGGLAGTLSGVEAVPQEWRDQVDAATAEDPYTNSRRTIDETADGLHEAFRSRLARTQEWVGEMSPAAE
ncbi:MAG: ADP-ribosylglycohydrolase family protein [Planctomycetota bacterium]|jgi:ADP-ribosylglycohydrolase